MSIQEKFSFLENEPHCYQVNEQRKQVVYRFREGSRRGLIGIPKNEDTNFWYKYFIKDDRESYRSYTPLEELPLWFRETVMRANEAIEKRDRVRKMFKQNYLQREF